MRLSPLLFLALPGFASAANCSIDLTADDAMKFDKPIVTVSSTCNSIDVKLTHAGKLPVTAMGHNVVISPTDSYQAVAQEGLKAGAAAAYVPANDPRVIVATKLVGGGESTTATFPGTALKAGGAYTFYCSFPGHWAVMKGAVVVE